ncbi:MAG: hypothetical protein JOZ07_17680, partial [Solirubrobacterales bacterium]|nr:hypothetical protein [Solirubrobacterales bacterium]
MHEIPYALSVHHFVSSVGSDAGFAAVIGLALLTLLFFAHARETAALRDRADEAEGALHDLQEYVDQLARSEGGRPARHPAASPASRIAAGSEPARSGQTSVSSPARTAAPTAGAVTAAAPAAA